MSVQATHWVLANGPTPSDVDATGERLGIARARGWRLVLLSVANAANKNGEHAHPGREAIIEESFYSRAQVGRILGELIDCGWLQIDQFGGGRGKATVYSLPRMKQAHHEPVDNEETGSSGAETGSYREKPAHGTPTDLQQRAPTVSTTVTTRATPKTKRRFLTGTGWIEEAS